MSSHGETPDRGPDNLTGVNKSRRIGTLTRSEEIGGPVGPAVSGQKILVLTCQMCGYQWLPRVAKPRRCPGCQSPEWERRKLSLSEIPTESGEEVKP